MKILVTGATGFVGRHIIPFLREEYPYAEIIGTGLSVREGVIPLDLSDKANTFEFVRRVKPDQVYHLCGSVTYDPECDFRNNVLSTANLLEAFRLEGLRTRILLTGSSAEYGIPEENPVRESHPLKPVSVYGWAKSCQTGLMEFYHRVHGMNILMVRPFNLIGREMPEYLFVGRVQKQIKDYKEKKIDKIVVGDLSARRDYIQIDEALTLWTGVMQRGKSGEVYHIGSGESISMSELLVKLLQEARLSMAVVEQKPFNSPHKFNIADIIANMTKTLAIIRQNQHS